jgi:hypothetical protein
LARKRQLAYLTLPLLIVLSYTSFIVVGDNKGTIVRIYHNVVGLGYDSGDNIVLLGQDGSIMNACNGKTIAKIPIRAISLKNACCTRLRINDKSLVMYYVDTKKGLLSAYFVINGRQVIYTVPLFGYNNYGVIDSVPCPNATCMVLLVLENNRTYVEFYSALKNSTIREFISNSLILQKINNSIVASIVNMKYNESIIYDVVNDKPLFVVPAVKPLFKLGIPFIQLIRVNDSIMVNIVLYLRSGFQSFIARPNSPLFDYFYPSVAASRDMSYYLVRNSTGSTSVIFSDGYTIVVPYILSVAPIEGIRYREPLQGVMDVDLNTHRLILRAYYNGSASILLVDKSWNKRTVLYSTDPQKIGSIYGVFCPDKNRVIVLDYGRNVALLISPEPKGKQDSLLILSNYLLLLVLVFAAALGVKYVRLKKE